MTLQAEQQYEHIGETKGCADHDHDIVHELSKRLDALWRYDQYVANAEGRQELQDFWRELKQQEEQNVSRLKQFVQGEIEKSCF